MKNLIDITNVTDNALDVILASGSGEVDCDHLNAKERFQVAEALGWDMKAGHVRAWIADVGEYTPATADVVDSFDYEGAILEGQEDFRA